MPIGNLPPGPSGPLTNPLTNPFGPQSSVQAMPELPFKQIPVSAPLNYSSSDFQSPTRGIASLSYFGRTWRFRTNPNSVNFSYTLNTNIEQTFGGRVVQILSCKIDDLVVVVEAGNAGWAYAANLALWLRDYLDYQKNPMVEPATFQYTTRNWKFKVYALSIPFQDQVDATVRPLELHFKVQEDVSGVVSGAIIDTTLNRLKDGIGWKRDCYNSGSAYGPYAGPGTGTGGSGGGFSTLQLPNAQNPAPGTAPTVPAAAPAPSVPAPDVHTPSTPPVITV